MMNLVAYHPSLHHRREEGIVYLETVTKQWLPIARWFATDSDQFSERQAVKNSWKQPEFRSFLERI